MASVVNETQVNFNPSWMQSVAKSDRAARMDRTNRVSVSNDEELMPPVFAKNRYGREDILALIGKGTKPPDGLDKCPFFVESPQAPIILQQLSEIEERLQQNINSSKALSSLPKSRQQLINGGASPEVSSHPNAGWVTAGSGRGGTVRTGGNRWSGLGSGSSSGNGPGNNESNPGYRPGRGNLMRVSSSGGHGSTANENMAGMGNRWSGLANPINTVGHEHTSGYRPARGGLSNATGRGAPASLRQVSAPQSREPEKTGDPSHLIEQQEKIDHSPPLTAQNETEKIKLISTSPALVTSSNHFGAQSREPEKIVSTSSSPNLLARPAHSTSSPTEGLNKLYSKCLTLLSLRRPYLKDKSTFEEMMPCDRTQNFEHFLFLRHYLKI
uniref:Uncharacterized protein n=1 Tax=Acrobeloides nanus TaxID=290746 RepID=A0A914CP19_9BILA